MPKYFLTFLALFTLGAGCARQLATGILHSSQTAALSADVAGEKFSTVTPAPTVTLQFFGDIMLDRNVARQMGKRGLAYIFEHVTSAPYATATLPNPPLEREGSERLWGDANITTANLEGPFAPYRVKTSKSIAFRFDPKLARQLKYYGFDGFSLTNNHTYDMGRRNVEFTRRTLAAAGLGYFGDELREGPEFTWVTSTPGGKVAFVGVHNTYHAPDLQKVAAALAAAKQKADFVIVNLHWGEEYKKVSNKKQRDLARWLINHGATTVIGHHPHVVQEMEIYKDKPIFYSLGNFIFDQYFSGPTQEGLSVKLILAEGVVQSVELLPFYSVKSQVYKMEGERRERFLQWMSKNSRLEGRETVDGVISL